MIRLLLLLTLLLPSMAEIQARSHHSIRIRTHRVAVKKAKKKTARTSAVRRSRAARAAFQRSNPCPATGKKSGSCTGYVVDHIKPLACGGADTPSNMQWQPTAAAKRKDGYERIGCE